MALPERKDMVVYKDTVDMEKEMEIKMSIQDALDTLNPMQREAAVHTEGPLLILAGAGSGKTRVLTHRIAYLMEEKGVNPWNILAITFTNKAASEMRERVNKIAGRGAESVWVSTFHSACVRILRRHIEVLGFSSNFTIYDTDDQKTVMKEIFRKFSINTKIYKERAVLAEISHAKDELITPEEAGYYPCDDDCPRDCCCKDEDDESDENDDLVKIIEALSSVIHGIIKENATVHIVIE